MPHRKIFLADDDQDDWFIIEDSMSELGKKGSIEFFADGSNLIDALNDVADSGNLPRLIVLDLNMPRTSGSETLHLLKHDNRFKHIPVIIYSTSVNGLEKQKCIELGAFDYVTKPVSTNESLAVAKLFSSFLA